MDYSPNSIYALSYIRQEHRRIVAFSQCFVIKGRMVSFKVVSVDVTSNRSSGFLDVVMLRQINFFIFEAAKTTLNHDVVGPAAFSVHALADIIFFYKVNVLPTCKLATLIRV